MKYVLTEVDLPILQAILEKVGVDERRRAALLRSVEVVPEESVAVTDHVEVEIGGEDHLQYLAKIASELIRGMPDGGRWIPGHDHHDGLPDPGTPGGGYGGPLVGDSKLDIGVALWNAAKELGKSESGGHSEPPKKQKVIHHPGKQWLDPGWHEKR